MGAHDQRPRYYEGQFLSAADLGAAVDYQRSSQARHLLGAHTWGIALGLTLGEHAAPGAPDRVEVILEPGLAWDGFGRAINVDRPVRLAEALFADIAFAAAVDAPAPPATAKGRLVKLWASFDEVASRSPLAGFEACSDEDQSARVRETFRFYVGDQSAATARRAPLAIGTNVVDAEAALSEFDPAAPRLWDTSVPHQTFPAAGKPPRWLVPIGLVRWVARDGELGYFSKLDLDPSDNASDRARSFRRYIGVVAQNIESADGTVVVHRREENPLQAHRLAKLLASGYKWDDLKRDLLWVEGNARIVGDAKLAGGALLLRDGDGLERKTPMYLARQGDGGAIDGNREMRAVIGPTAQIDNRFIVGPEQPGASPPTIAPRLVVTSGAGPAKQDAEGRVGVNTRDPLAALEVKGDWDGSEDGALRLSGAKPTLRFAAGGDEANKSWIAQVGDKGQGVFRIACQFQPSKWESAIAITALPARLVGIGTEAPATKLHVKGDRIRLESTDGARIVDLRSDGSAVDLQSETSHLYLRSTTPPAQGAPVRHIVMNSFPTDGRVGIGRVPVAEKLEVQGHVKLGPLANLFAMGANRPIRAVIGQVASNGSFVPNLEFTSIRTAAGNYRVDFVPPFAGPPVVLVTALNASNDDNVMTVVNVAAGSFEVHSRDVVDSNAQATNTPVPQDDAFTFVAFGPA